MDRLEAFYEHVSLKFQLYNGLLLHMPFAEVQESGMLLPLFVTACSDGLNRGVSPAEVVEEFLEQADQEEKLAVLFSFLRLIERQVVLFDSLEDAGFHRIHEMKGPGTLQDLLNRVERKNRTNDYRDFLDSYEVRIVLTAHPTQFYTDEVLSILTDLASSVENNEIRNVHDYLLQLAQTRFKNPQKPTPLEEAKSLMWILENVMYPVVPELHSRMVGALHMPPAETLHVPGKLLLGFWPGGDRDGNPFVTAELTEQVAAMLRVSLLKRYLADLQELRRRLTFSTVADLMDAMAARLEAALDGCSIESAANDFEAYASPDEFLTDLKRVYELVEQHHNGLFADKVVHMIYRVQCFGFHFASLDIRQDSSIHDRVWQALLPKLNAAGIMEQYPDNYDNMNDDQRRDLLTAITTNAEAVDPEVRKQLFNQMADELEQAGDAVGSDVLRSILSLKRIQQTNGITGAHRYIISNSQSDVHVLEVLALMVVSGMPADAITADIVPLFETIDDLHNADSVMTRLYNHRLYKVHLAQRQNSQTIMLGFSDGTKDGGYLTANWEIYRAKERLTALARKQGVRIAFFDGRGGPPARGGGNTHKFYRSLGKEIDSSNIQVTIQGQTISSMYGTPDAAAYNLEQIISAGIENNLFVTDYMQLTNEDRTLLDELSMNAQQFYSELRNHPQFVKYLEKMTPLTYYGNTNIGSRPVKRGGSTELSLDKLRAIPFVGGWSQSKLNVPGFYGFGTALQRVAEEGRLAELQNLCSGNLFFRTIIENSMQSLTKANFKLTSYHADDAQFGSFWHGLKQEAVRTREILLQISGQGELLDTDPVIRASIDMREKMILPSLIIQQYALHSIRQLHEKETLNESDQRILTKLEKLVVKALAIGVNASRNSV